MIDINSEEKFELRNIISNSTDVMKKFLNKTNLLLIDIVIEKESSTEKVLDFYRT